MKRPFLGNISKLFVILTTIAMFFGCNDDPKVSEEVAKIPLNLEVSRFDLEFDGAKAEDIPKLKRKYPYLFPEQFADSVWAAMLSDSLQLVLRSEVKKAFPDFKEQRKGLELLYKHIRYYFPQQKVPRIITVTNNVDYQNRIIATDSLVLIGLDNYLGSGHEFYQGMSNYLAKGLEKRFLVSDVASAFAKSVVPKPRERSFLAQMIYYGKELYLKDKLMPLASDAVKIGYTEDQLVWAAANEEPIWRNFVENEYLYSTDTKLNPRFLDLAPFSKFGLELDNESPGRIGRYMGWQIVRAFMEKNSVSLQQLLNLPADEIFKKSNYKPNK
ncbi:gliding motility lipoprotein GldB [Flavobacteriaceae bacterium TP-CH-4]|uniref:Gliding motility lipoprotein GldB n=2 Tax=Pelagihabitans pacificus TaxID=2696054 RepID=A0A967AV11_9FLAO|nr:gliding motility lipoprotein GldB [Pelagihabitans pacificus]